MHLAKPGKADGNWLLSSRLRPHGFWATRQKSSSFVSFIVFYRKYSKRRILKACKVLDEYFVSVSRLLLFHDSPKRSYSIEQPRGIWFCIRFPVRFLHFLFTVFSQSCDDFLHLHYTWFKIRPEVENSRNRSCKRADLWLHLAGIAPFPWPLEDGNCCNDLKDFEVILTTIFVGKNPDSLIECGTHLEGDFQFSWRSTAAMIP